jgi:hypothetical protein
MEQLEKDMIGGYCHNCQKTHTIDSEAARAEAVSLVDSLDRSGCFDIFSSAHSCSSLNKLEEPLSPVATESLFGFERGKMLGVLLCHDDRGQRVVLRGFSGQINGLLHIPGWVGPVFDEEQFHRLNVPGERRIKQLSAAMEKQKPYNAEWLRIRRQRREQSRVLMRKIFSLYRLLNFQGEEKSLLEVFKTSVNRLPPTGTGDCCSPKLLVHAARNNLTPYSLAEIYYGRENCSGTKRNKQFFLPCESRCQPILGFSLCGVPEARK